MNKMLNLKTGSLTLKKVSSPNDRVSVTIAGDFCVQYRASRLIRQGGSEKILKPILPFLADSDLVMLNLECPLTRSKKEIGKSGPAIKSDPRCIDFLKTAGVDIANLANNHIGDFGPRAAMETIGLLKRHGIKTVGAGRSRKEASRPLVLTKNNIRLAVLAYAENEFGLAEEHRAGGSPLDPLENCRQIRSVARQADITLVMVHGGNEYNPVPSPRMVKTYRAFAEAGAAAVIGNHPHCPQGIEVYRGVPIVYSLGNFLFDRPEKKGEPQVPNHFWMTGYLIRLVFGTSAAWQLRALPYTFKPRAETIRPLTGNAEQTFYRYLDHISRIIPDDEERRRYWHGWCALQGPEWVWYLKDVDRTYKRKGRRSQWRNLLVRNAFTCEAHHELLATYLRLVCEGKVGKAKHYIPRIKQLMRGEQPG